MRVGIDYRILSVGPALVTRGMGRYTQQQLRAVLDADDRNEYVLLANRGNDLSLIVPEVLEAENTSIEVYSPPPLSQAPQHTDVLLRLAEDYQAWMARLDLDVYHATTPFLLEYPLLLQFDVCPMVATFYDAIPLIFAEHYYGTTVFDARGVWYPTVAFAMCVRFCVQLPRSYFRSFGLVGPMANWWIPSSIRLPKQYDHV